MSTSHDFTFPGLWPYIERAAEGRAPAFLGRGRGLWHYKQIQDSLGQLPGLAVNDRRELLAHVAAVRDSLAAALDGIDLAIRESILAAGDPAGEQSPASPPIEPAESTPRRAAAARRRRE